MNLGVSGPPGTTGGKAKTPQFDLPREDHKDGRTPDQSVSLLNSGEICRSVRERNQKETKLLATPFLVQYMVVLVESTPWLVLSLTHTRSYSERTRDLTKTPKLAAAAPDVAYPSSTHAMHWIHKLLHFSPRCFTIAHKRRRPRRAALNKDASQSEARLTPQASRDAMRMRRVESAVQRSWPRPQDATWDAPSVNTG